MNEQCCGNCWFFRNKELTDEGDENEPIYLGECRRYPPSIVYPNADKRDEMFGFPEVHDFEWCGEWKAAEAEKVKDDTEDAQQSLSVLGLSTRASNCLGWWYAACPIEKNLPQKIETISDLTSLTAERLLETRNFGTKLLREVRDKLAKQGLKLKGD